MEGTPDRGATCSHSDRITPSLTGALPELFRADKDSNNDWIGMTQ